MGKRRASGEGSIYQMPNGRWRGQVSAANGQRFSRTAASQGEIKRWIKEITSQVEGGLTYDAAKTTVGVFLVGWLAQKRPQLAPATAQLYEQMTRKYIAPGLGRVRIQDCTPAGVQRFYDGLLAQGVGARTVQVIHLVLHGCLEQAVRLGLAARNATDACMSPRTRRTEVAVWSEQEVSAFLAAVHGERNEHLYHVALATGMRRGEILGLKWSDVDWIGSSLRVQRQVFHARGGGWAFREPKTARGRRSVPLGVGIVARLRAQLMQVEIMRKSARERWQENDLVFPSLVGTPQGGRALDRDFLRMVRRSGLRRIRFHDLRHTAASLLLAYGTPPVLVASMLGHSMGVLMERYAHLVASSASAEAARLMDELTTVTVVTR